jgi:hypothetical protein
MKTSMITALLLALVTSGLVTARAQGTLEFTVTLNGANEVPPNSSDILGSGSFSLNPGDILYYGVAFSVPAAELTDVTINGPAGAGSLAPVLFDLGAPGPYINPPPGFFSQVSGSVNLTGPQVNDLLAGLWYVNATSSTYPGGEIRGQIVLVPEPSTGALFGAGVFLFWWYGRRKQKG